MKLTCMRDITAPLSSYIFLPFFEAFCKSYLACVLWPVEHSNACDSQTLKQSKSFHLLRRVRMNNQIHLATEMTIGLISEMICILTLLPSRIGSKCSVLCIWPVISNLPLPLIPMTNFGTSLDSLGLRFVPSTHNAYQTTLYYRVSFGDPRWMQVIQSRDSNCQHNDNNRLSHLLRMASYYDSEPKMNRRLHYLLSLANEGLSGISSPHSSPTATLGITQGLPGTKPMATCWYAVA